MADRPKEPSPPSESLARLPLPQTAARRSGIAPRFVDGARRAGIDFTYFSDAVPERYFLPEVMGGGAAWLDYDGDGLVDLYLTNGCPLNEADRPEQHGHRHRLYRHAGVGKFVAAPEQCGAAHNGYGQGIGVGDFDADGFPDLYVTCFGPNVLYHNQGDGTFADVTQLSGTGDPLWGTGAVWLDADADGDLDLFVANYLEVTLANSKVCVFGGQPGYCGPGNYEAQPDRCFQSAGDGTFVECSAEWGLVGEKGNGLAVLAADLDDDLVPELYVANDMAPNYLFSRTVRTGVESAPGRLYADLAPSSGCAVSGHGQNEASMGVACADFDNDGRLDLFLTHYYHMKNTLYRNLGGLVFEDDSYRSKVAAASHDFLGFGTVPLDYDRDGAMDLFITNGHVLGPHHEPNAMTPKLLHNDGTGRFDDVSADAGPYFQDLWLGRGAAGADFDDDGDLDLLVTHLERPYALLRNESPVRGRYLGLRLITRSRLPPLGARVTVQAGAERQTRTVMAGGSYLSVHDERLLFGFSTEVASVRVEITWPSGSIQTLDALAVDRYWTVREEGP
ncbi:MAG: CRTAC1 family protein [Planctomycetales bacterium]